MKVALPQTIPPPINTGGRRESKFSDSLRVRACVCLLAGTVELFLPVADL